MGDFSQIPSIELVAQDVLASAFGGYASSTNKIYLSRDFLRHQDRDIVTQVLLEEIGHYLDSVINDQDSLGDEGKVFAKLSLGLDLSPQELRLLQSIDDKTSITVAGEELAIEQSSLILEDLFVHTPADLVSALLGSGVATSSITYTGGFGAAGLFLQSGNAWRKLIQISCSSRDGGGLARQRSRVCSLETAQARRHGQTDWDRLSIGPGSGTVHTSSRTRPPPIEKGSGLQRDSTRPEALAGQETLEQIRIWQEGKLALT
jgi:predicted Zn-dependent protease with MMP-like domain